MKRRTEPIEEAYREVREIRDMLNQEGQSAGECRKFVFMASLLLRIGFTLNRISVALFALLGFIVGKFLASIF